jgi:hypothetical protein
VRPGRRRGSKLARPVEVEHDPNARTLALEASGSGYGCASWPFLTGSRTVCSDLRVGWPADKG